MGDVFFLDTKNVDMTILNGFINQQEWGFHGISWDFLGIHTHMIIINGFINQDKPTRMGISWDLKYI
jgi:hypothetical protein